MNAIEEQEIVRQKLNDFDKIIELFAEGRTQGEVAAGLGVSKNQFNHGKRRCVKLQAICEEARIANKPKTRKELDLEIFEANEIVKATEKERCCIKCEHSERRRTGSLIRTACMKFDVSMINKMVCPFFERSMVKKGGFKRKNSYGGKKFQITREEIDASVEKYLKTNEVTKIDHSDIGLDLGNRYASTQSY